MAYRNKNKKKDPITDVVTANMFEEVGEIYTRYSQLLRKPGYSSKRKKGQVREAPKGPIPSYFKYQQDNKGHVQTTNPGLERSEIVSKLQDMWRNETEEVKQAYAKSFRNDFEAHKVILLEYERDVAADIVEEIGGIYLKYCKNLRKAGTKRRKKVDPNAPKGPTPSYFKYQQDHKEDLIKDNPDMTRKEIVLLLQDRWKNESMEVKNEYREHFRAEYEKHKVAVAEYNRMNGGGAEVPPQIDMMDE